ncbi:hypothetical protein C7431_11188 [Pantoea allii]|uniref:Uncharacterized protein n=1 Tax=Pantoea allii TaxID=574096 RepID=A0A2V2B6Y9_9GAMM|nr:hypothetical protein [Pantoea allii]PWK94351.1 hypothetical protein C7431_11188 [Pantoea allii]
MLNGPGILTPDQKRFWQIFAELQRWKNNDLPPQGTGLEWCLVICLAVIITAGLVLMALSGLSLTGAAVFIASLLVWTYTCRRVRKRPILRWPERLDRLLSQYRPVDSEAWAELKADVVSKDALTLAALQRWMAKERMYYSYPKARNPARWRFLQNNAVQQLTEHTSAPERSGD